MLIVIYSSKLRFMYIVRSVSAFACVIYEVNLRLWGLIDSHVNNYGVIRVCT